MDGSFGTQISSFLKHTGYNCWKDFSGGIIMYNGSKLRRVLNKWLLLNVIYYMKIEKRTEADIKVSSGSFCHEEPKTVSVIDPF